MDASHYEQPLQGLARDFRINGTRWGHLRNLAEVPLFVDSRASRLVQLADLVAFAMWRQYEHMDGRFFKATVHRFDQSGGVLHGWFITEKLMKCAIVPPARHGRYQDNSGDGF